MNIVFPLNPEDIKFSLFSFEHVMMLLALIGIDTFILISLKRINNHKLNTIFRIALALILVLLEISGNLWKLYFGKWTLNTSLPLHLCGISAYLSVFMLIFRKYVSFELVYFWGLGGAVIALLTPNIDYNLPHIMFIKFFLAHNAIFLSVLYMIFIEKYRPALKSVLKTFLITNIYMMFIAVINYLTGANYLYISHKPGGYTLLDFFGPWPYYLISMEFAALLIFFILYLPFSGFFKSWTQKQMNNYKG
ncbi:MAG: TIGR02206 family membrane protein [Spirochaetes bacterium]|nr:TIGR02206 family membrane protein [Spirochaetota bacterium]